MSAAGARGEVAPGELGLTLSCPETSAQAQPFHFKDIFSWLEGSLSVSGFPLPPTSLAVLSLGPSVPPAVGDHPLVTPSALALSLFPLFYMGLVSSHQSACKVPPCSPGWLPQDSLPILAKYMFFIYIFFKFCMLLQVVKLLWQGRAVGAGGLVRSSLVQPEEF